MISSKFKIQNSKFGFTMIELLIVIAVLGVLATAVLSAINPIEQINRGRDTGSRSDAEQLLSAMDRYYTTQEIYPWQRKDVPTDPAAVDWTSVDVLADPGGGATGAVLYKLSTGGTAELKASFVTRISVNTPAAYRPFIHMRGTAGDSVYVCFLARSGSFKAEALDRCDTTNNRAGGSCASLPLDLSDVSNCTTVLCSATAPYICLP